MQFDEAPASNRVLASTATVADFRAHIDPKFYETRYVKAALRDLFRRA